MASPARAGADSEVGRLRTVLLHRPGAELERLTPQNHDRLLFDGIPWVGQAQDEHDAFAAALRERDVEVLYLTELLTQTLQYDDARAAIVETTLAGRNARDLGDAVRDHLRGLFLDAAPEDLTRLLTAGVRNDEVRAGIRGTLVTSLLAPDGFLLDPLPNLLFTRDSSVWLRDRVAVTSLATEARRREAHLTGLIYRHHPRFAGAGLLHGHDREPVEGGDVLQLAPGCSPSASVSGPPRRVRSGWPARRSRRGWRPRCSPYRSRASAPPCTSTRSARWSTSTGW